MTPGVRRDKIGLLGGTFDPVHFGHLRLALEIRQTLNLDDMRLLPCGQPPHRDRPGASARQRLAMLKLALADCRELTLDAREMQREGPSYTLDTLMELRRELGDQVSLVLAMGVDAFAGLHRWHRWQELLNHSHILVLERPGWALPATGPAAELLRQRRATPAALEVDAGGSIVLQSLRLLPISASDIRRQLAQGQSPQFLLPEPVRQYIGRHGLYQ